MLGFNFGITGNPLAKKEMNFLNDQGLAQGQQANDVFGVDWAAIQKQLNPDPGTRAALTQLPVQAANAQFGSAQQDAKNRMARTNNSAGYSELTDKLAMDRAKAGSTAALQGQQAVTGLQNEGVKNASDIFGIDKKTMADLYGGAATAAASGRSGFNFGFGK